MIKKDIPGRFGPYFTGYLFILVGTLITFLFQSSSAFTSSLIPMVGAGLVELERVFPLTLGSNIGIVVENLFLDSFSHHNFKNDFKVQQLLPYWALFLLIRPNFMILFK